MTTRRPKVSRDDTRKMFIEAGRAILREEGLGTGEVLTLKRVCERVDSDFGIRFTNASIIGRIWKNQFEYQTEVLATIAADDSNVEVQASLDLVVPLIVSLDTTSEKSRRWSLQELCRVASAVHMDTLRQSTDWSLWIGMWAITAVGSAPERRRRVDEALQASYSDVTEQMEGIYTALLGVLGYRLLPGVTTRQFTIAAAALAEGCVLRDRVDSAQMNGICRPTGRDGEDQEWTLLGIAFDALTKQFYELDPDWVRPEDAEPSSLDGSDSLPPEPSRLPRKR